MANKIFQNNQSNRLRTRDVTLVGINNVIATRQQLAQHGPGNAGGGGNINQPDLDEDGELIEPYNTFWRVGGKVGSKPIRNT